MPNARNKSRENRGHIVSTGHRWPRALGWALLTFFEGACPSSPRAQSERSPSIPAESREPAAPSSTPAEQLELDPLPSISPEQLEHEVRFLAADELGGRSTPSPGLELAADRLREVYEGIGLAPLAGAPDYRQTFDCSLGSGSASNIVGWLPGTGALAKEAVIVSAHYDHIGQHSDSDDTIFNGANDNASGVAAMLAIATVAAKRPSSRRRSLIFIAFCGEELGLVGSRYWVDHPLWPLERTIFALNLEMLGRPHAPLVWVTGMEHSTLGTMLQEATHDTSIRVVPAASIGPEEGAAFDRSDNYPFAQRGVIAHTISTGAIDHYYHSVEDDVSTLKFDEMALLVQGLALGVLRLSERDQVPQWHGPIE